VQFRRQRVYVNGELTRDYSRASENQTLRVVRGQTIVLHRTHVGEVEIHGGTLHVNADLVGDVTVHDGHLIIEDASFIGDVVLHGNSFFRLNNGCHVGRKVYR